ncbi:MAG: hypothetical protein ACRC5V_10615 [Aeromonas sp.]
MQLLLTFLDEEYSLNTFTTKLSRPKLFSLAENLPNKELWSDNSFDNTKKSLCEKFDLTSNDLSRAINLIKSNYELSHMIGLCLPLKGISKNELILFLGFWAELHANISPRKYNTSLVVEFNSSLICADISHINNVKAKYLERFNGCLTPKILADLTAIYYFARENKYSENYVARYESGLKRFTSKLGEGGSGMWDSLMHIANKTDFFSNLLTSLSSLHHDHLAKELSEIYSS